MAKNIDFMGAIFPDVPSVKLPQQGGGLVSFDDTTDATATADKILQGYTAYVNGEKLVGTASGGITPTGTISITQNGVVDVTQYASADVNVSGGGASNFVTGTFTVGSTASANETVTVPYTGSGYPLMLVIVVDEGMSNLTNAKDWYYSVVRYAVGQFVITKSSFNLRPEYRTAQIDRPDKGDVQLMYKNSTSTSTTYSSTRGASVDAYSGNVASGSSTTCVKWINNTTISYRTAGGTSSSYGLLSDIVYRYYAVYSS